MDGQSPQAKVDGQAVQMSHEPYLSCSGSVLQDGLRGTECPEEPFDSQSSTDGLMSLKAASTSLLTRSPPEENRSSLAIKPDDNMILLEAVSSPLFSSFPTSTFIPSPLVTTAAPSIVDIPGTLSELSQAQDESFTGDAFSFDDICRICAETTPHLVPLYIGHGLSFNLVEKIHRCLPIEVSDGDGFPKNICEGCTSKLEICDSLIKTSINGNAKLLNIIKLQGKEMNSRNASMTILQTPIKTCSQESQILENPIEQGSEHNSFEHLENSIVRLDVPPLSAKPAESINPSMDPKERQWSCGDCNYKASRKSSLMLHKRCKHNVKSHIKSQNKVNEDEPLLGEAEFLCEYCDKSFQSETKRKKHMITHTKHAMLQSAVEVCNICSEEFFSLKAHREHLKTVHHVERERKYSCDICGKSYHIPGSLDIHLATHSKETPFLCDICGKSFKHSANLRCHKRSHADIKLTHRHSCDMCPKSFPSKFHLKEHMNVHLNLTPYACGECGKKFSRRIQLRQHWLIHNSNSSHKCPQCGACFNRRGNMTQHMKRHLKEQKRISKRPLKTCSGTPSNVPQKGVIDESGGGDHSCSQCSKSFPSLVLLEEHARSHVGSKYQCSYCSKQLSNCRTLDYHIRSFHTGERPFPCQYCSESFLSRETRTVHERIHTGEKPYTCNICQMSFRCSSNLAQHSKSHQDDRPWACTHCSKSFKRKGILLVHLRTHTGEKPFCCDICGRRFTQKNDMLKHQQTHKTTKQTFTCCNCNWSFPSRKDLFKHRQIHHCTVAAVETNVNCVPPVTSQHQTFVIADDLSQFPITILDDRNNIIIQQSEDLRKHSQVVGMTSGGQSSQVVHFSDTLFHAVVAEPQVLELQPSDGNHIIQYDGDGSVSVLPPSSETLLL